MNNTGMNKTRSKLKLAAVSFLNARPITHGIEMGQGRTAARFDLQFDLPSRCLDLLRLAVCPTFRRQGVGTALVDKLKSKITSQRRRLLTVDVPETNLPAHLFLAAQGLRATAVVPDFYGDADAYRFQWRLADALQEKSPRRAV